MGGIVPQPPEAALTASAQLLGLAQLTQAADGEVDGPRGRAQLGRIGCKEFQVPGLGMCYLLQGVEIDKGRK